MTLEAIAAAAMTWARPRAAAAVAWARAHPTVVVGVLLVVVAVHDVQGCRRASSAEGALEAERTRAREARELDAKGVAVVAPVQQDELARRVAELEGANEALRSENARVRAAAAGARPVAAVRASTGPVPAAGAPRGPDQDLAAAPSPAYHPGTPAPAPSAPPREAEGACLLAAGDTAEARVDAVEWQTRDGNEILAISLGAYRLTPAPETRLFGGPASVPLTRALEAERPAATPSQANAAGRWGVGLAGGVAPGGWLAGLAVASPSVRLPFTDRRVEWWAAAAAGPGGVVGLTGPLLRL